MTSEGPAASPAPPRRGGEAAGRLRPPVSLPIPHTPRGGQRRQCATGGPTPVRFGPRVRMSGDCRLSGIVALRESIR